MSHLAKYTNIINLKKVTECVINRKSLLETFSIIFQNMELTCSTTINNYVKCILSAEEYNNTEKYVKDHKIVLKKLDIKNNVQLTYLLFTFTAFADEYEIFMKSFIEKIFQKQVA
ncbi:unnamed protein product [Rhizophagus irregularis]|uniref:Uncharacterized protein n=1 Tax=Rhizophagus irregularis TaxID=588596 RepID=A0A2N1M7W2_9GLOM|nr:hypothetical protein RhiirC2_797538 [Rhizophagus irregularis]CAB4378573.1 unnamed protein product [Rhizophagus irregularis]CAB5388342.1 unnamed protein product [Rhizophagus irregularis]